MKSTFALLTLAAVSSFAAVGSAADLKGTPVLGGLTNPSGIAVQPGTGKVFVSNSAVGTILELDGSKTGRVVVKNFPKDVYGKGPMYDIGPLGLAFADKNTLIVGDGSQVDGKEVVRIYDVSAGQKTKGGVDAASAKYTLGPIAPGSDSEKGEGNFYAVAVGPHGVYFSSNGDDTKGWVLRTVMEGGTPGPLKPFIATKIATNVDAPVGLAVDKQGNLVVGQMGEINKPKDSLLSVYDGESGKLLANSETGLYDIAGLAFSPKTGKLYAVDYAWMDTKQGGLYRLDVSGEGTSPKVTPVKLASLDKPTALAFGPDGTLYVTVFGTDSEGATKGSGAVLSFASGL